MKRIEWIDFLRGISMVFILAFHTEVYYKQNGITPYYIYTSNFIVLFYFISGYLFYRKEKFQWKKKIKSIINSLLIPYFIFTTLIALPKMLVRQVEIEWLSIIINILTGRASWFIAALIVGEIIFCILLIKTNENKFWLLICAFFCFILYYIIPFNKHNYWQWQDALLTIYFLYLGYIYHRYNLHINIINKPLYSFIFLLILILIKVYEYHLDLSMRNIAIENAPLFLADSIIWLLFIISFIKYIKHNSLIEWIGRHCIVYYFLAGGCPMIISIIMKNLSFSYDGYFYRYLVVFLLVILLATALTWIIYKFFPFITGKKLFSY